MLKIIRNIFQLSKIIIKREISWKFITSEQRECKIDKNTNISKLHNLYKVEVGFATAIGPNSNISLTKIGKFCSIGPNVLCGWGIHPVNGISISPVFYSTLDQVGFTYSKYDKIEERKPITIGNDVFIGANVTILDGVNIGDGAVIGAGAVVSKDIPPYAIAVGCPIRVLRYRFPSDIIDELLQLKWWDKDEKVFKNVEKHFFDIHSFINELKKGVA